MPVPPTPTQILSETLSMPIPPTPTTSVPMLVLDPPCLIGDQKKLLAFHDESQDVDSKHGSETHLRAQPAAPKTPEWPYAQSSPLTTRRKGRRQT